MPPDGYTSITVPDEVAAKLTEEAEKTGADSLTTVIESLVDSPDPHVRARIEAMNDGVRADFADEVARRTAEEVERRLR